MANRITAWAIDCQDPARLAEFWTAVLGWVVTDEFCLLRRRVGGTAGSSPFSPSRPARSP